MDVFDLVAKLSLDTSEYEKGLDNSEKSAMNFGSVMQVMGKGVAGAAAVGTAALAAMGTVTIGATSAIIDSAAEVAAYGDNIDKMSQKMGISIEAYQEWDAVMQHSGTSMESLKASMKTLANAAEKGNEAFVQLGISEEQLATLSNEELFSQVITGLQNMEEGTERTYIASQLLGRGATELGALLNTSAEETQAMKDRVHELGGVMSEEAVKSAAQFQDNLQDLQTAMEGIKRNIVSELLPGLSTLMDGFTRLLSGDMDADTVIEEGIGKLLDGITNAGEKIMNLVTEIFPRVVEGIAKHFPDLIKSVVSLLQSMVPTLLSALSDDVLPALLGALPGLLETLITVIPPFFFSVLNQVLEFLPLLLDLALQLIMTLAEGIAEAIPNLIPTILTVITTIVSVISKNLPMLVEVAVKIVVALIEGLLSNMDQLSIAIEKISMAMIATFIALIPEFISAAVQIVVALITAFVEGILKMLTSDFWEQMLDAIVSSFTDIDWAGIGMRCLEGIADGFIKGISKVVEAAKNVATSIKNVFTGEMEIHSPSKIFEGYGKMIDEGLAIGIGSGMSINATKNMSENVSESFTPSLAGAGTGGDIIIPVSIGNELLQTIVVEALDIANYRSGGR